jgi:multicomponent Na+:H+ antiporter subunit D
MEILAPLPIAVPLATAAVLTATSHFVRWRIGDPLAVAAATLAAVVSTILLLRSAGAPIEYWFGGWRPRHGVALGIAFSIDPFGAGMAALAATLVLAALVFSWHYFADVGPLFHVLVLVFLAGMSGFALSGDLFNMFVFFELMSVAAYALTGYRVEEEAPLEGALNFGITNSIGALLILTGIALLYGHTGALNLAQIGRTISAERPHGLVIVAFTFLVAGFFAKAAAVPFHFWHADAHAVAPSPVCAVFSGVMVQLGFYAIARVYWAVFASSFAGHAGAVRAILVAFGLLTALVAAVMCFLQRHLKRMLAYSTISEGGMILVGIALLGRDGLAGAAAYVLAHGLAKASLFLCVGIVLYRLSSVDELRLRGAGRRLVVTRAIFLVAALSLVGVPPIGTYLGRSLVEDEASRLGYGWLPPLMTAASIVSVAAILRAGARVFLGWGTRLDPLLSPEPDETSEVEHEPRKRPPVMLVPAAVLALAGAGVSLVPGLEHGAQHQAERFESQTAYARAVLSPTAPPKERLPRDLRLPEYTAAGLAYGAAAGVGAILVALVGLWRPRVARSLPAAACRVAAVAAGGLRSLHSGAVGDYVTWLVAGTAVIGGLLALTVR